MDFGMPLFEETSGQVQWRLASSVEWTSAAECQEKRTGLCQGCSKFYPVSWRDLKVLGVLGTRNISISGNEYWVNCRKSFLRRNFMRWLSSNLSSTARPSWSRRLLVFGRFGWIRFGRTAAFPSLFVIFNSGYLRPLVECAQMSMGQNSQNPDILRCKNQNSWYMNIHPPNIWYNHVYCIIGILQ